LKILYLDTKYVPENEPILFKPNLTSNLNSKFPLSTPDWSVQNSRFVRDFLM
jgi:hypothetical protein